jgi:hypothetical protein
MRGVKLITTGQFFDDDGRARERDEQAREQAERDRPIRGRQEDCDDNRGGDADLQDAGTDHPAPDAAEIAEREVEADREQQEHDANFGEQLDVFLGPDDADAAWSGNRAGRNQRDDRRDPQTGEGDDQDEGERVGED